MSRKILGLGLTFLLVSIWGCPGNNSPTQPPNNPSSPPTATPIATSTPIPGSSWTARTLPSSQNWSSVTYGNGVFVAVAYNSTVAATSPDGITPADRALPRSHDWYSVTYGNGVFVWVAYCS